MSLQDELLRLAGKNDQILRESTILMARLSQNALFDIVRRVFEQGQATDGTPIGDYSTKPTRVGATSFLTKGAAQKVLGSASKRRKLYDQAKQAGQPGAVRYTGARRAAIYFPDGYKGIREAEGRQTAFVDLDREGRMRNSYQVEKIEEGTRVGFDLGFTNKLDHDKMRGNEGHFGKNIIDMSEEQAERLRADIVFFINSSFR